MSIDSIIENKSIEREPYEDFVHDAVRLLLAMEIISPWQEKPIPCEEVLVSGLKYLGTTSVDIQIKYRVEPTDNIEEVLKRIRAIKG